MRGMKREPFGGLSLDEIDKIAEIAASKAEEKIKNYIFLEVGKGVIRKAAWLLGTAILVMLAWLQGKGLIK